MEINLGCGLKLSVQKNATNKGTLIRTEAVERFTPTDSRANTIGKLLISRFICMRRSDSDKATPPLPTLCNSINGVNSLRSIHELRGLLNYPLRRSRTNSSISPTSSLRPPKHSPSKNSLKSSESGSSTTSMTVREGEYEDGFIDILLEKFSDSFGFVVLTKPFERNGQKRIVLFDNQERFLNRIGMGLLVVTFAPRNRALTSSIAGAFSPGKTSYLTKTLAMKIFIATNAHLTAGQARGPIPKPNQ